MAGYGGQAGNGSEKVLNLITTGGGISLEGASIEVQGSQLNAQKDIKIVSTQGSVKVDGVRNEVNDQISQFLIEKLNKNKSIIEENITSIENNPEYISQKTSLELQLSKIGPQGGMSGPPHLVVNAQRAAKLREDIANLFGMALLKKERDTINDELNKYNSKVNGFEHNSIKLKSYSGNILINSSRGVSISGANISAIKGVVDIEAQGILDQLYTSTTTKGVNNQSTQLGTSIIIDGQTNFYDKGNESDENYSMRTFISPTMINGDKGITIRATGNTNKDNLVLQATGITAANGDVRIEANKNILFDAAIEQSFDRITTLEKDKSWAGLKTKYITTVAENNRADATSVDISGKNIFIESKEKNSANNIDIYSGKLTANGGQVSILSGGHINLYTVQESSTSNVDITKKSSFAGIKYNKSNTTSTRSQISELPGVLKADYIGIKADNDVRLVGTEFEYLQGAKIEAGRELSLLTASTTVTETLKKDKNSVVWQSMQDKGSVTETAQLPRFNGPTPPDFKAAGGLVVQIPVGEKDQNKIEIRDQILTLANQPGNDYLKQLVNRNDVDWQKVILAQKDWDYKSQGLTAAGAAIIAIVVAALTYGGGVAAIGSTVQAASGATTVTVGGTTVTVGAGGSATFFGGTLLSTSTAAGVTTYTTTGIMINAAVTSIATQASVGLVNNQGDISKTVKDLGSKDSVKNLAASVVTAGLLSGVAVNLNITDSTINQITNEMANGMIQGVGSTLIDSAINGRNLSEGLEKALLAGFANSFQVPFADVIGNTLGMSTNIFINKVVAIAAHAAAGCLTGLIDDKCQARALGASLGEVIAENMFKPANGNEYTEAEKIKIRNVSKLTTGVVAAYVGFDVTAAANAADIAVTNNYLSHAQEKQKRQELNNCSGLSCSQIMLKWAAIDAKQNVNYATGFAVGIPNSLAESVIGLVQMGLSPIETYNAIRNVINSENTLGNISGAIKQDYINRIDKLEEDYQKAGTSGAYNAGLESGKLVTDVISLLTGGVGIAKSSISITEKITKQIVANAKDIVEISLKKSVVNKILIAERTGSGLKADPTHIGASFLNYDQLMQGKFFKLVGGDGVERTLLQVEGGFNGKKGIYEYIIDNKGNVTHQRFIKDGRITGKPNQTPPKVK